MKIRRVVIFIVLIIVVLVFIYWQNFIKDNFNLSLQGNSNTQVIVIKDGQVVGVIDKLNNDSLAENSYKLKEIMVTDGVKHSVALKEIKGGGPAKDGIPSIDNPKFISIASAEKWLDNAEPGIAINLDGQQRFYPFQILVWHEIVNDKINNREILVTYCPLCLSGIVFDPLVLGDRVEFGTSGKLWNSNLVMYDRKTDSLWSQILGEAIVGEMTGTKLKVLESDQIRFGEWKKLNPSGEVLSRETGAVRFYGTDPYGSYYVDNGEIISPVNNKDNRLDNKDFILGVVFDGQAKAYLPEIVKKVGKLEDSFAGKKLIIEYIDNLEVVRIFEEKDNGERVRINPLPNFWFSWVAIYPNTELFK